MARVYISSSWSNDFQPDLVRQLRERGHKVYDFRHPSGRDDNNVWDELGINKQSVSGKVFDAAISDPAAESRFSEHFAAMQDADTCILLLPCGRSSHVEAGFMAGRGKRVFVYDSSKIMVPELMYLTFDNFFHGEEGLQSLFDAVAAPQYGVCRVCGCTEENPCYHPEHGTCWWVDAEHTLCSHCATDLAEEGEYCIADDPLTEHCINDHGDAYK